MPNASELTDAENDEEDDVDDELAKSGLDGQFFVSCGIFRLLCRPQSYMPTTNNRIN